METMAIDGGSSPLEWALAQVGDRWSLLVVHALLGGPKRFGELSEALGVAPNVLSQRLKRLEGAGIVVSERYSSRPPRFAYDLSAGGRELAGALHLLAEWGSNRSGVDGAHHEACGTPMEPRWWCPTCERAVDDAEGDELRFV